MAIIDLSHPIVDGQVTYPGLPPAPERSMGTFPVRAYAEVD